MTLDEALADIERWAAENKLAGPAMVRARVLAAEVRRLHKMWTEMVHAGADRERIIRAELIRLQDAEATHNFAQSRAQLGRSSWRAHQVERVEALLVPHGIPLDDYAPVLAIHIREALKGDL